MDHVDISLNIVVLYVRCRHSKIGEDFKVENIKVNLNQLSVVDKINLHRQTKEVIYLDMLHSASKISNLQCDLEKVKGKLVQEKPENKAWRTKIKDLEENIIKLWKDSSNHNPIKDSIT